MEKRNSFLAVSCSHHQWHHLNVTVLWWRFQFVSRMVRTRDSARKIFPFINPLIISEFNQHIIHCNASLPPTVSDRIWRLTFRRLRTDQNRRATRTLSQTLVTGTKLNASHRNQTECYPQEPNWILVTGTKVASVQLASAAERRAC